ncbi:thiocyanate hydrolase [Mycobacterium kyorinense]|uniref:Thiocyanate hydrolase n=1 Tax=Mycobacterium kyorinense TaxID=487514 RepID=A0A1A2ZTV3_9MYCO|nr:thiocyanate hydrolase [Mycobacterium kyorinense]OBI53994.1 thiocyanate hydrolase [Mycobacterium kyorinense]
MSTEQNIPTLERIIGRRQEWARMAEKYGVSNPLPPWKSSLDGMCDALDREGTVLPLVTRRGDEDRLSQGVYATLPFPENQLVALAHSLITRNVIDEAALADRMAAVRARLEAGDA